MKIIFQKYYLINCFIIFRYLTDVIGDGIVNQQKNPEVTVDVSQPNSLVNEQVFTLKTMNNRLKSAYNGMDVEWIDNGKYFQHLLILIKQALVNNAILWKSNTLFLVYFLFSLLLSSTKS